MIFNSLVFLVFLTLFFVSYHKVKNITVRNIYIIIASYVFYGWWDWRFLFLIFFSSCVDYFIGLQIGQTDDQKKKKGLLITSLVVNLGLLGFFKYYNFFVSSFIEAFAGIGVELHASTLNIILPVGISFYTFQTLSYTIDCYRGNIEPTKDAYSFFAFVSFFPQLVAGPIERATNLLPQFYKPTEFNFKDATDGLKLMLWGFFKKMVVADNCAIAVNSIFADYADADSLTLLLGMVFFAFQIYGDFSGYSDIAIGTAKLLGFDLMQNFNYPYFSRDIAEFWRRWHISLSTWFRDYVYIPLGGSRVKKILSIRNVFIIFVVSGFWHGANWTFMFWGALNAIYFLPLILAKKNRKHIDIIGYGGNKVAGIEWVNMFATFFITCLAWVFFRAPDITTGFDYIINMFQFKAGFSNYYYLTYLPYILILLCFEWIGREKQCPLYINFKVPQYKYLFYACFATFIVYFSASGANSFIYFQF